jgi:hypothetical protein
MNRIVRFVALPTSEAVAPLLWAVGVVDKTLVQAVNVSAVSSSDLTNRLTVSSTKINHEI